MTKNRNSKQTLGLIKKTNQKGHHFHYFIDAQTRHPWQRMPVNKLISLMWRLCGPEKFWRFRPTYYITCTFTSRLLVMIVLRNTKPKMISLFHQKKLSEVKWCIGRLKMLYVTYNVSTDLCQILKLANLPGTLSISIFLLFSSSHEEAEWRPS